MIRHRDPGDPLDGGDAAAWTSDGDVARWLAGADERERRRTAERRLMADLLPFGENDAFVFVDLGAGSGAAAGAVLEQYPAATAILADFSPQMAEAGTKALDAHRGRFRYVDFDLADGPWPASIPDRVDAVVTSMVLHHLPDDRKEELLAEVLARLVPGGWFLDFDLVAPDDPLVEAAWNRARDRTDRATGGPALPSPHEHAHQLHLSPLPRQLDLLRSAGFEAVDTYWKRLDAVILGGRRPVGRSGAS
jgi:tRNA (cmo5U34)-methyltransferase